MLFQYWTGFVDPSEKHGAVPTKHCSPRCWGLGLLLNGHTCYQTWSSLHVGKLQSCWKTLSTKSTSLCVFQVRQTTKEWVYFEIWGGENRLYRSSNLRRDFQVSRRTTSFLSVLSWWLCSIIFNPEFSVPLVDTLKLVSSLFPIVYKYGWMLVPLQIYWSF